MPKPPRSSQPAPANCRIALVCDWLTTPGGAEKVLLELHRMYPDAPIYTSQYNSKKLTWFKDADVRTGWLQVFPSALRKVLGPLRQLYFSHLDLSSYDLVISVTGAEAKSVRTTPKKNTLSSHYSTDSQKSQSPEPHSATHLCYCHVPTQYYWQMYDKYVENPGFGFLNPLVRLCFRLLVKPLRKADYRAAGNPTQFITISTYAAAEIKQYYNREATIIAPPVEIHTFSTKSQQFSTKNLSFSTKTSEKSTKTDQFSTRNPHPTPDFSTAAPQKSTPFPPNRSNFPPKTSLFPQKLPKNPQKPTSFPQEIHIQLPTFPQPDQSAPAKTGLNPTPFVISCRQVTWKRVDLAIEACLKTNSPLLVIGDGPEHQNLVKLAKNSPLITFIPWLETDQLAAYLQSARAYLFPSLEPFGIAAVEALAAGCPVIAYAEGGSRDFVHPSGPAKNGLLFPEQTSDSLADALNTFNPEDFDPDIVKNSAKEFAPAVFRQKITALVTKTLKKEKPHENRP